MLLIPTEANIRSGSTTYSFRASYYHVNWNSNPHNILIRQLGMFRFICFSLCDDCFHRCKQWWYFCSHIILAAIIDLHMEINPSSDNHNHGLASTHLLIGPLLHANNTPPPIFYPPTPLNTWRNKFKSLLVHPLSCCSKTLRGPIQNCIVRKALINLSYVVQMSSWAIKKTEVQIKLKFKLKPNLNLSSH